eukprot:268052_1
MQSVIFLLLSSLWICFGCNYISSFSSYMWKGTNMDKASVPINVCYGSDYYSKIGWFIYKCEDVDGVLTPFEYRYQTSNGNQCDGSHTDRTDVSYKTHDCTGTKSCDYTIVKQYAGRCGDWKSLSSIDVFVTGDCISGARGTCNNGTAELTTYASDTCSGSTIDTETYNSGCGGTNNNVFWEIDCHTTSSPTTSSYTTTSSCAQLKFGFVFVVVLFGLYFPY